jgi:flagella basal body P-ring formation protein FlgA
VRAFGSVLCFLFSLSAGAEVRSIDDHVREDLSRRYNTSKIEFSGPGRWTRGSPVQDALTVEFAGEPTPGEATYQVRGAEGFTSEWTISFRALQSAYLAARRIRPGERLSLDAAQIREVNVAQGLARELRNLLLKNDVTIDQLESRQTFLEGQLITLQGVNRVPDVRRGDTVQVRLTASGLTLNTVGIVQEPARIGESVRVLTRSTKREIVGRLTDGRIAEVAL